MARTGYQSFSMSFVDAASWFGARLNDRSVGIAFCDNIFLIAC